MSLPNQKRKVRPEGADHHWRKMPPRELSVDLVADERGGRVNPRVFELDSWTLGKRDRAPVS